MKSRVLVCLLACLGAWPSAAAAQAPEDAIVTDRPDFTESSEVVGKGTLQIEMGAAWEHDNTPGDTRSVFATPQALVRLGAHPRVELRFASDGLVVDRDRLPAGRSTTTNGSDIEIGSKVKLTTEEESGLALALIPSVSLPTGGDAVSSGGVDPGVKVTWARSLPSDFGLSGNVNAAAVTDGRRRFSQFTTSVSLGHDLGRGFAGYWEVFGFSALERGGDAAWTFDTGVTRGFGPNMQVDATFGCGLTAAAPDWFVSAGFSVRRPARVHP